MKTQRQTDTQITWMLQWLVGIAGVFYAAKQSHCIWRTHLLPDTWQISVDTGPPTLTINAACLPIVNNILDVWSVYLKEKLLFTLHHNLSLGRRLSLSPFFFLFLNHIFLYPGTKTKVLKGDIIHSWLFSTLKWKLTISLFQDLEQGFYGGAEIKITKNSPRLGDVPRSSS